MATYVPAKLSTTFITYIALRSQADSTIHKVNPTLAAGDFLISKDGGATASLNTLPTVTPAGGAQVKVTVSSTETGADNASLQWHDVSGAEWFDGFMNIPTSTAQIDDLATAARDAFFARAFGANYQSKTFAELTEAIISLVGGPTTGAGTTSEAFKTPDGSGTKVTVTNDGTNRTGMTIA